MFYKRVLAFLLTCSLLNTISASGRIELVPESSLNLEHDAMLDILPVEQSSFPSVKRRREGEDLRNSFNKKRRLLDDSNDEKISETAYIQPVVRVEGNSQLFQNYQVPIHYFEQLTSFPSSCLTLRRVNPFAHPSHENQLNSKLEQFSFHPPTNSANLFKLGSSTENHHVDVSNNYPRLFEHLLKNFNLLNEQEGKLVFNLSEKDRIIINLPDLSREAVELFVEVTKGVLPSINKTTDSMRYKRARVIPNDRSSQKELMSQFAQIVCVALRLKFDEGMFFRLLEWYKKNMNGIWEELLRCGNEFVGEVEAFFGSVAVAMVLTSDVDPSQN